MSHPRQGLNASPRRTSDASHGQEVLDVLGDSTCRRILRTISDRAMTADEIATIVEQPLSTVYRKLDRLSRTALVTATTRMSPDGHHPYQYQCTVDRVDVQISGGNTDVLDVDVSEDRESS